MAGDLGLLGLPREGPGRSPSPDPRPLTLAPPPTTGWQDHDGVVDKREYVAMSLLVQRALLPQYPGDEEATQVQLSGCPRPRPTPPASRSPGLFCRSAAVAVALSPEVESSKKKQNRPPRTCHPATCWSGDAHSVALSLSRGGTAAGRGGRLAQRRERQACAADQ